MKTKVFKNVMPVFVMLLAIGLSFATNASPDQVGYYDDPSVPGIQEVITNCSLDGEVECKVDGFQVYSDPGLLQPLFLRE